MKKQFAGSRVELRDLEEVTTLEPVTSQFTTALYTICFMRVVDSILIVIMYIDKLSRPCNILDDLLGVAPSDSVILTLFAKNFFKAFRVQVAIEQGAVILHRAITDHVDLGPVRVYASFFGVAIEYKRTFIYFHAKECASSKHSAHGLY